MRQYKYLQKLRYLIAVIFIFSISLISTAHASGSYDVTVHVLDAGSAELKLTYPISSGTQIITALSSKKDGDLLDGHRELISANAQDGSSRVITNDTPTTDAQIRVQPGDQTIALIYRLSNVLGSNDVSLFNFLLFLGAAYPTTVHIRIIPSSGFDILSHSIGSNEQLGSDGSINMDMIVDQAETKLLAKNLTLLVYPKSSSSYVKKSVGDFTIVGSQDKENQLATTVSKIGFFREMFNRLFGASLPSEIDTIIVPIKGQTAYYEPSGLSLQPNIILIDPEDLSFSAGPNDPAKTIIHELGHLALAAKGIFSGQLYYARWLDEGLAVFGEEYATDNYIIKTEKDRQIDTVLSSIKKMTPDELKAEYAVPFDYNFSISSGVQPISRTYSHAGLIMYNLYLQDATLIPRMLESLKNKSGNVTCKDCDTNTTLSVIQDLSGFQRDEIIYPYKNSTTVSAQIPSLLTIMDVDQETQQNIKEASSQNLGSYIDKNAPVEQFTIPNKKLPPSNVVVSTSTIGYTPRLNPPTSTEATNTIRVTSQEKPFSFFERIRLWIISLF